MLQRVVNLVIAYTVQPSFTIIDAVTNPAVLMTVSGPYGQYTIEALVAPEASFTLIPAPALIELGIEPHRVVRVQAAHGEAQFRQLGRALTTVGGQEDVTPVLFGEPGEPPLIGAATLSVLLLRWDPDGRRLVPFEAQSGHAEA